MFCAARDITEGLILGDDNPAAPAEVVDTLVRFSGLEMQCCISEQCSLLALNAC